MTTARVAVALPDWVALRARTHGDHVAVEAPDATLTYAALDARVGAAAAALRARGLRDGAPVALLMTAGSGFATAAHAVPRAGGVLMPLNARLATAELAWQLADAGARLLVADEATLSAARAAADAAGGVEVIDAEALVDMPAATPSRSSRGSPDRSEWVQREIEGERRPSFHSGRTGEEHHAGRTDAPGEIDPGRPHSVLYTSGTTGRPKGALLTHGNFHWSAVGSGLNLGVDPADRWLACMPLFHVGGLSILLRSAIYGTTAVVHERFDEARVNRALREQGVTLLSVVATMLGRMLDADDAPYPSSVRAVLVGGGPAPRPLLEAARDRGLPVLQTYGLTEAASQVTTLPAVDGLRKPGSSGLPLPGTTVRIAPAGDADGARAVPGEIGEILVAGPTVTPGYRGRPDATAAALRGGWLRTGDVGFLDAEGYLTVVDRREDLIVSGGENVYPAEVEAVLLAHPGVLECAVFGAPDEAWGQRVTAVIVTRPGAAADLLTTDALAAFCRERLAAYKVPRTFAVRAEALPRTASGKLQRHLVMLEE